MKIAAIMIITALLLSGCATPSSSSSSYLSNEGIRAMADGDHETANILFERAFELDPSSMDVLYNLIISYHETGNDDMALRLCSEHDDIEFDLLKARILKDNGDFSGSCDVYLSILEKKDDPKIRIELAEMLVDCSDTERAIEQITYLITNRQEEKKAAELLVRLLPENDTANKILSWLS